MLNTLFPVFALVGLALWLARAGYLTRGFLDQLNWLIFRVSLPALIVKSLATVSGMPTGTLPIVAIFLLATLGVTLLAFPVCRLLGLARERVGTFVQAAFRGNIAYTGLPIVIFALQDQPRDVLASAVAQVMFIFAPAMLFYNTVAVFVLVGSREGITAGKLLGILRKVAVNPLIMAALLGIALYLTPLELPRFVLNTLDLAGMMAAPAALICVGGSMAFVSMQGRYRSALVATGLKVLALPAISALLMLGFDLDPVAAMVLLILSACPTAVASYVMVKELNGDEALASGAILISTVACIPVYMLILAFTGHG